LVLENAATVNDGGRIDIPTRRIAAALCEPFADIETLFAQFEAIGLVADSHVGAWKRRQYESDTSTARVRKHRKIKRDETGNGDETFHPATVTPPETETETEKEVVPSGTTRRARKRDADPVPKPVDVEDQVWVDFNRTRKAELTLTALRGIKREADKAGWALNDALAECATREWRGFKAEWVKEQRNGQHPHSAKPTTREIGERVAASFAAGGDGIVDLVPRLGAARGHDTG
jgi:hypothetical protein